MTCLVPIARRVQTKEIILGIVKRGACTTQDERVFPILQHPSATISGLTSSNSAFRRLIEAAP